jgi:hypothetical protein
MKTGVYAVVCMLAMARPASSFELAPDPPTPDPAAPEQGTLVQSAPPDATLFRVFLKNGTTLVSYGEVARVGDRLVFSMPVALPTPPALMSPAAFISTPDLQLVNIAADHVDWTRTDSYAESARSAHYLSTRAMDDYARLSNDVAQTLNDVARTADPASRLAIVESARKRLAEWPAAHYNFNYGEVQQLLVFLDEAIADLRASAGASRFNLSLVAAEAPVQPFEPLLPPPTLKESIEQVLVAAGLADSPQERVSLLSTALAEIDRDFGEFPGDWAAATAAKLRKDLEGDVRADRAYTLLTQTSMAAAVKEARAADVRGIERLLTEIHDRDTALGASRSDVVSALIESVQEQLDAARRLQLARDHWAVRLPALRRYRTALRATFDRFDLLKPSLENIRALAGSTSSTLASVERLTGQILRTLTRIKAPEELQPAHALLASAAQLAGNAATTRREAARAANMAQAWDASSAAAGSLMLSAHARDEIHALLRLPQLHQ